jgi:hypothetical protein
LISTGGNLPLFEQPTCMIIIYILIHKLEYLYIEIRFFLRRMCNCPGDSRCFEKCVFRLKLLCLLVVMINKSRRGCLVAEEHLAVGTAFAVVEPEAFPSVALAFVVDAVFRFPSEGEFVVAVPSVEAELAVDSAFRFPFEGPFAVAVPSVEAELAVDSAFRFPFEGPFAVAVPSVEAELAVDSAFRFPSEGSVVAVDPFAVVDLVADLAFPFPSAEPFVVADPVALLELAHAPFVAASRAWCGFVVEAFDLEETAFDSLRAPPYS